MILCQLALSVADDAPLIGGAGVIHDPLLYIYSLYRSNPDNLFHIMTVCWVSSFRHNACLQHSMALARTDHWGERHGIVMEWLLRSAVPVNAKRVSQQDRFSRRGEGENAMKRAGARSISFPVLSSHLQRPVVASLCVLHHGSSCQLLNRSKENERC